MTMTGTGVSEESQTGSLSTGRFGLCGLSSFRRMTRNRLPPTMSDCFRVAIACTIAAGSVVLAQPPRRVDFGRDVAPIFKSHCIECHGPTLQSNGLRLDRRADAMRGGTIADIGPGNAEGSRLYLRLIGSEYGLQMPPTGPLSADDVATIRAWIDQGAIWPDELSGESSPMAPDPIAVQLINALRGGHRGAFDRVLRDHPDAATRRGGGGSTPLMYAGLYGDNAAAQALLDRGADPNERNGAGATALMWAVDDLPVTRTLLEYGADPNARSDDFRTPLLIASGRAGANAVVGLLIEYGANVAVKAPGAGLGDVTPLSEAASIGDAAIFRTLAEHGANVKSAGPAGLHFALQADCDVCRDMILASADRPFLSAAMLLTAPPRGDARRVKLLLDRGADPNAADRQGHTILMLAASSDNVPVDVIRALLDRGADLNAATRIGDRAIDFAAARGRTPIVGLLAQAGARETTVADQPSPSTRAVVPIRTAIDRSLPLLQRTDDTFLHKSGCVSCHHNSVASMTIARAEAHHLSIDISLARDQRTRVAAYIETWRERILQGDGIPGLANTISYILLGMAAEHDPPSEATEALARYLKGRQLADGRWRMRDHRPPIISSDFQVTAASVRGLQAYAPARQRPQYDEAIRRGVAWLQRREAATTEDRAFQLLGLAWGHADRDATAEAARALLTEQRVDGGWAQLPTLASDAYATGEALVALKECGALRVADQPYKRGVAFLLSTQAADGSWHVKSRSIPIMPSFESGFPYGRDQWVSAAATNWATMALINAAP
jgi:ankyrin repeat protein